MDYQEYLSELQKGFPADNSSKEGVNGNASLTIKVDIDAIIYCDDVLLGQFKANVVQKFPIEVGLHLITIESKNVEGVSESRKIDIKEAGNNYIFIVDDLCVKTGEAQNNLERRRIETEKRIAEIEKRLLSQITEKEKEISELKAVLKKKNEEEALLLQRRKTEREQSDKLSRQLEDKEKEVAQLKDVVSELKKELKRIQKPQEDIVCELNAKHEQALRELENMLDSKHNIIIEELNDTYKSELSERDREIASKSAELEMLTNKLKEANSLIIQLQEREAEYLSVIERMKREFEEFKKRVKMEIDERNHQIEQLQSSLAENKEERSRSVFSKIFK